MESPSPSRLPGVRGSRDLLLLSALLLAGLALRSVRLNAPFHGLGEGEGAVYGQEFRNLHRYGLKATRGWPCDVLGRWNPGEPLEFHASHWPLPVWLNVAFQKAVDVGANPMPVWSIRALPVLCGALIPLVLWALVYRLAGRPKAWVAAWIAAILPGPVFFSQAVSAQMPLQILLSLLAALAYLRWIERPSPGRAAALALALASSLLTLWQAYYLVPVLLLFHLGTQGRRLPAFPVLPVFPIIFLSSWCPSVRYRAFQTHPRETNRPAHPANRDAQTGSDPNATAPTRSDDSTIGPDPYPQWRH